MREKTVTYKVYKFSELSEKAKEKAKQQHCEIFGYYMADEAMESLKKLAEHFGGKLIDWDIDWWGCSYSYAKFDMPDEMLSHEIRARLNELGSYDPTTFKGKGECKLTGVCTDEDCIDGFRIAFNTTSQKLTGLMQAAFQTWLKAQQANAEDEYTDETFGEMCEANNYEFRENGDHD